MSQCFQTIPEAISAWAQQTPDHIALLSLGREPISYGQLLKQSLHICDALDLNSVTRSQRVAICSEDRPSLALCMLGLLFHGAAAIPIDPFRPDSELASYLQDLRADVVVTSAGEATAAKAAGNMLDLPVIEFEQTRGDPGILFDDTARSPGNTTPTSVVVEPSPSDCAFLLSTSGTTGSKTVPRTHGELAVNADRRMTWLGLGSQDRCVNVMPLHLGHGIANGLLAPLYAGGSAVIASGFDTDAFFACLGEYKPTWYTAVYTFHRDVMSQAAKYKDVIRNSSLSFLHTGGMQFPIDAVAEIETLFGAPLIDTYSMTETDWIASAPLPPKVRKVSTVGLQVIDGLKVIDENGVGVAVGHTGEIVVRGPGVMKGYIDNPEANAEAFVDGWFRTGDLGYFDEDGYLTLAGRIKEIISRGSEKVSPWDVELVLAQHPNVDDVAVFGVPHATLGEDLAAAVVFKDDQAKSSLDDLTKFAFDRLSRSKVPRRIFAVASIPKGPGGKPQRNKLADELVAPNAAALEIRSEAIETGTDVQVPVLEIPLTGLWKSALGVDTIGRHDRFSDLGGTETIAAGLLESIRYLFAVDLTSACLFEDGDTVAKMAELISRAEAPVE